MAVPNIWFETRMYPGTRSKQQRVVWSDDRGATWHEPEDDNPQVVKAWLALQRRQNTRYRNRTR